MPQVFFNCLFIPETDSSDDDDWMKDSVSVPDLVECLIEGNVDTVDQYLETLPLAKRDVKQKEVKSMFRSIMQQRGVLSVQEDVEEVTRPVFGFDNIECSRCEESALVRCEECDDAFCESCSELIHASGKFASHSVIALG